MKINKSESSKLKLWQVLLLPLSLIFFIIVIIRRYFYKIGLKKTIRFKKPVIVVGNITVGGSGKTPLVIAIVKYLQKQNLVVAVVSRGYKGKHKKGTLLLDDNTDVKLSGDEPKLILAETKAIVAINKNRADAVNEVIKQGADVIISDDGLQHYAMDRDIEIVVIDNMSGIGNGFLLPSGILREGLSRLNNADILVYNHRICGSYNNNSLNPYFNRMFNMNFEVLNFVNIATKESKTVAEILATSDKFYAISAIARPDNFFEQLRYLGFDITTKSFTDHYLFKMTDFDDMYQYPLLMTHKDAVKCSSFATKNMWYLAIKVKLDDNFFNTIYKKLIYKTK